MPFIAETLSDTDWTLISVLGYVKLWIGRELRCQACRSAMHLRRPTFRRTHFAHNPGYGHCPYDEGEYKNEREEHKQGKDAVDDYLFSVSPDDGNMATRQEYIITLGDGRRRIVDVALFRNGEFVEGHEVQLAHITPQEIDERTKDYESVGAVAAWYLGLEANINSNQKHLRKLQGVCLALDFVYTTEEETNIFDVQADSRGKADGG